MNNYIKNTRPEVKRVTESFIMNYLINQIILSVLIAVSEKRFHLTVNDVHCAGRLVENSYRALVEWLEQALRVERQSIAKKSGISDFKQGYFDSPKDNDGWVNKRLFIQKVVSISKVSAKQVYIRFKKIDKFFDQKKIGKTAYIKLQEEYL